MSSTIVDELDRLRRSIGDAEYDVSADALAGAVCSLLGDIILKDEDEEDKFCDWADEICALRCKLLGVHTWEHDHCGYWGHQYCYGCKAHKYPELAKMTCVRAIETIGRITEEEYQSRKDPK